MLHPLALPLIALSLGSGEAAEPPAARIGKVLWQCMPLALRKTPDFPHDFSPDGKSFLYLQGDPWPRVVLQPLPEAPGQDLPPSRALGGIEPFGDRSPRYDLQGRRVFFTGDFTPRGAGAARPFSRDARWVPPRERVQEALRLAVVRAPVDGSPAERIFPSPGAAPEDFAVFLDLHPGGRTVLLGSGKGLMPLDVSTGSFALQVCELDLDERGAVAGPPRPLSFQMSGLAPARYSWDGKTVFFGLGGGRGRPGKIQRYDRASGSQEILGPEIGWLAGDLEVLPIQLPHPGSFGWDGFPLYRLTREAGGPSVPLLAEEALAAFAAPAPLAVRGRRILLAGGAGDRRSIIVAEWDAAAFETALAQASRSPAPEGGDLRALIPGFSAERLLARGEDPRASEVIGRIHSSRIAAQGGPVRAIRAVWTQRGLGPGAAMDWRIEAVETAAGEMWVERTRPGPKEGDPPSRDVLARDGEEGWALSDLGETTPLGRSDFVIEGGTLSPIRLLLDPAGLGFPWIRFRSLGDETERAPDGSESRAARLEIASLDGYRADLRVALDGERALPARIESPLLFPEERMRRDLAASRSTKTVAFEEYRPAGGRLVPGRIRFDDGINSFELVLVEAEINPADAEKKFQKPAGR